MKSNSSYEVLGSGGQQGGQTHVFTSFPEAHQDEENDNFMNTNEINKQQEEHLLGEESLTLEDKKYSIWQIEYYQKYFNVNTSDIIARLMGSIVPTFNQSFLLNKIRPNPDLYGPFWICTTLIFTIAISGNVYSFLSNFGSNYNWQTDFHKVTTSAFVIIIYWWLMPISLFMIMRWRALAADFQFIEVLSIYGYSLFVFIPVSILWLIHISFIQWALLIMAIFLSSAVLVSTFWPTFSRDPDRKIAYSVMAIIVILHSILAIGFMVYFFHSPDHFNDVTTTTLMPSSTSANKSNSTKTG